jgi:hypothetical protein
VTNVLILGPWREKNAPNRAIAETLRDMGHIVTPSRDLDGLAAPRRLPALFQRVPEGVKTIESLEDERLASALFRYDAVIIGSAALDHGRIVCVREEAPVIVWEHEGCDLLDCLCDALCKENVTFVSDSEERVQKAKKRGLRRAKKIERPGENEGRERFKGQLKELLETEKTEWAG